MSIPRKDVALENTWNLELIFENTEAFEKAFEEANKLYPQLKEEKENFKTNGKNLYNFLNKKEEILQKIKILYQYAHLLSDQDLSDNENSARLDKVYQLFANFGAETSFIETELANLSDEEVNKLLAEESKLSLYAHYIEDLRRGQKHILSEKEESLLAKLSPVLHASEKSFSVLNNSDMPMPTIKNEKGEDVQLSHGNYAKFLESENRTVRKDAYFAMRETYAKYKNTYASFLASQVKYHNLSAELRNFSSAREASLFYNAIPENVYENLVTTVRSRLGDLHKYMQLRKEITGLDEMQFYDLYQPLVKEVKLEYSIEEAKEILLKALAPLGEDYVQRLQQAFDERWIDFVDNKGKRSGAYSSGCQGTKPYILITWQNTLDNLYTLAHELGHSLHSMLTFETQAHVYASYSIFLAEIASTLNENLLTHYLLKNANSKEVRLAIINHYIDGVKGTVFRQTQFAEFEQKMHELDQQGLPLTAESLSKLYFEIEKAYYGEALTMEEDAGVIFARIPHFYYNFYVYQYATGFSAATAFAKSILTEGQAGVDKYLGFLKAGCSDYPIEVLKKAGLDMSSPAPIEACLDTFAEYVNLLEKEWKNV